MGHMLGGAQKTSFTPPNLFTSQKEHRSLLASRPSKRTRLRSKDLPVAQEEFCRELVKRFRGLSTWQRYPAGVLSTLPKLFPLLRDRHGLCRILFQHKLFGNSVESSCYPICQATCPCHTICWLHVYSCFFSCLCFVGTPTKNQTFRPAHSDTKQGRVGGQLQQATLPRPSFEVSASNLFSVCCRARLSCPVAPFFPFLWGGWLPHYIQKVFPKKGPLFSPGSPNN